MRGKISPIIVGSLLAAIVCLTPTLSMSGGGAPPPDPCEGLTEGQCIVARCRFIVDELAVDPDPNCFGKCVSLLHTCADEETGDIIESDRCEKKESQANEACGVEGDNGGDA